MLWLYVQGRWGKVHKGRWHGEVAIRLLEIDGNNEDHLKVFKKEVMNYRQTRHENVILFMGACMAPPHLAIITRYCCMTAHLNTALSLMLVSPHFKCSSNHECICALFYIKFNTKCRLLLFFLLFVMWCLICNHTVCVSSAVSVRVWLYILL